jgi:predicted GNAT family acetyltransferase
VSDNVARSRFELGANGASGFIAYRRSGTTLYLNHAEVPAALAGHGVGTKMVTETLELIRRRGERIVPVCSFVEAFVRRHPAYADLCVE